MIIGNKQNINRLKSLADNNFLSQGYIFFGPNRVGKKTIALSLANYLETKNFDEPKKVLVDLFEIDASNSGDESALEQIRNIKNFLYQKPIISKYRTVIIDNAFSLNKYAQNALLKISEEPTDQALIILICDGFEVLLPTLNSRFQKIYFSRVKNEEIKDMLIRNEKIDEKKAEKISKISNGLPGFAISILKDETFKKYLKDAKMFLNLKGRERINFIKDFFNETKENDNFNMNDWFDSLMLMFGMNSFNKDSVKIWEKILEMRKDFSFYNLNPKIHFLSLANLLNKND